MDDILLDCIRNAEMQRQFSFRHIVPRRPRVTSWWTTSFRNNFPPWARRPTAAFRLSHLLVSPAQTVGGDLVGTPSSQTTSPPWSEEARSRISPPWSEEARFRIRSAFDTFPLFCCADNWGQPGGLHHIRQHPHPGRGGQVQRARHLVAQAHRGASRVPMTSEPGLTPRSVS